MPRSFQPGRGLSVQKPGELSPVLYRERHALARRLQASDSSDVSDSLPRS
jgi:hypothetical protein